MRKYMSIFFLLIFFGFIAIGRMRQEHLVVLKKAVNICLECIGVG